MKFEYSGPRNLGSCLLSAESKLFKIDTEELNILYQLFHFIDCSYPRHSHFMWLASLSFFTSLVLSMLRLFLLLSSIRERLEYCSFPFLSFPPFSFPFFYFPLIPFLPLPFPSISFHTLLFHSHFLPFPLFPFLSLRSLPFPSFPTPPFVDPPRPTDHLLFKSWQFQLKFSTGTTKTNMMRQRAHLA